MDEKKPDLRTAFNQQSSQKVPPRPSPESTQDAAALNPEPNDQPAPQQVLGQASPDVQLSEQERKEAFSMGLDAAGYRVWQKSGRTLEESGGSQE